MNKMFLKCFICFAVLILGINHSYAQKKDIPVEELPIDVKFVIEDYFKLLKTGTLDDCEVKFARIAGGDLIDEDGSTLREDVKPAALKRDRNNLKFYATPLKIARVTMMSNRSSGFGVGEIKGTLYKVWLPRKENEKKLSYISVLAPENHPTIKSPKIVEIGNL